MRKLAMLLAALMALFSFTPAQASEWTNWTRMNPNSYKVTIAEMQIRCVAGTAQTSVTVAECQEAVNMVQAGQCSFEPVPDGIRYEFMNGLKAGEPFVYTNMVKSLGTPRKAFVCKTSSGRTFDWYVGEDGISCGNLGARELILSEPPMLTSATPPAVSVPPAPPARVTVTTTVAPRAPEGGSVVNPLFLGVPGTVYAGGSHTITVGSRSTSASTSSATAEGACKQACPPKN